MLFLPAKFSGFGDWLPKQKKMKICEAEFLLMKKTSNFGLFENF